MSVAEDVAAVAAILLGFLAPVLALMAVTIFFIVRLALQVRRRRQGAARPGS